MNTLFTELKRRNIFRVAGVYAVVGWVLAQIVALAANSFGAPDWVMKMIIVALIIGFPIAMLLAWAIEMTPEGVKRTESVEDADSIAAKTGRKLDFAILGGLVLVGALVVGNRFVPQKSAAPEVIVEAQIPETDVIPSIAVLPFVDLSPAGDQEYFSDGMAEEILNALVKLPDLLVAGRTSSFAYKGRDDDIRTIGAALNVTHVLEGSVRKQEKKVRITVQLIQVSDGFHLWSETYDGTLEDIFDLQDSISKEVAKKLNVLLSATPDARLAPTFTSKSEAYELFLEGRDLSRAANDNEEIWLQAFALLEQATEIDPDFAEAWAELGRAYLDSAGLSNQLSLRKMHTLAEPGSLKALELDPENAMAHVSMGVINWRRGNRKNGLDYIEVGLGYDPNYALGHYYRGLFNLISGRTTEALPHFQRAVELDPYRAWNWLEYARASANAGELENSDRFAQRAIDLGLPLAYGVLSNNAFLRGENDKAFSYMMTNFEEGASSLEGAPPKPVLEIFARALAYKSEQDMATARAILLTLANADADTLSAGAMANFPPLGMIDELFEIAPKNIANTDWVAGNIWMNDPSAQAVRQHPDFPQFAKEMGFLDFWQTYGWPDLCRPVESGGSDDFKCE